MADLNVVYIWQFFLTVRQNNYGNKVPVFIKRQESNFFFLLFFPRYLHHRRWIWTVQFNQSPILMPEASVTRILTTLLRVRQLEGFTFAHSKVCLSLYYRYYEFIRCHSPIWFANFSTNFSQFEQLKKKTNLNFLFSKQDFCLNLPVEK